ncbi:hypothetical protein E4U42_001669 [Claviceps africana]|uniref:Uncharacterized protein n=1 Tax=Claviceps africana TaxID=83212 RepID=A0A8K0NJ42_9HYPO|nr:hypothetical protein E4U42_001669 [Claviceps africana]
MAALASLSAERKTDSCNNNNNNDNNDKALICFASLAMSAKGSNEAQYAVQNAHRILSGHGLTFTSVAKQKR